MAIIEEDKESDGEANPFELSEPRKKKRKNSFRVETRRELEDVPCKRPLTPMAFHQQKTFNFTKEEIKQKLRKFINKKKQTNGLIVTLRRPK